MKVALDTNILVYAEGVNGESRRAAAIELLQRLPQASTVIPVQVLGELLNVLVRKAGWPPVDARAAVIGWSDAFPVTETSLGVMQSASDLVSDHQFGIWDAVIFSAASRSNCRMLLSEDFHAGFTWAGTTVVNPFAPSSHFLLDAVLRQSNT